MTLSRATIVAGPGTAPVPKDIQVNTPLPAPQDARTVQLRKVATRLSARSEIGEAAGGLAKVPFETLLVSSMDIDDFHRLLRDALTGQGYRVVGEPDAIFQEAAQPVAELIIGASIRRASTRIWYPYSGYGNFRKGSGDGYVHVDWEIYDPESQRVLFRTATEGSAHHVDLQERGRTEPLAAAFAAAAQNLLAQPEFAKAMTPQPSPEVSRQPRILSVASQPASAPDSAEDVIDRSRMSVLTIMTDTGHGSGFLISRDGYVLTNEHVVAGQRTIRAKTATGRIVMGEVLASDKALDVALVKLEEDLYTPLHPGTSNMVRPGSDVYAIGAPVKQDFGQSVTRGIVSGLRVHDGHRYIQSDVTVNPGNSGGPLITRGGVVVGIACLSMRSGGAGLGINLFIPIEDALAALNIRFQVGGE